MSAAAAPVTVHAGIFVQSRLPILLHRVIPAGTLSLNSIGMIEAGIWATVIASAAGISYATTGRGDIAFGSVATTMAAGAAAYYMAPP